jgi:hypothetical protein
VLPEPTQMGPKKKKKKKKKEVLFETSDFRKESVIYRILNKVLN